MSKPEPSLFDEIDDDVEAAADARAEADIAAGRGHQPRRDETLAALLGHARGIASAQVRRVVWTDQAQANLAAIRGYIAEFSPLAAQRFALKLVSAAEDLSQNPDRG